ncbi:MAG: GMC family oxidoreductase, partial [Desulfobacterales bacterium]|nr:GMC family oxidoreductase [Desulfobacterales bacterium]
LSVVVLEEGSSYSTKNFNQDPGDMMSMMYRDSGTTMSFGLPPASIIMGKGIGGSTTINAATCFRVPEKVINNWAIEYGCEGLDYKALIPHFEKVEKEISVTELSEDVLGNVYQIVKRGAKAMGLDAKPLKHNVKNCEGAGACTFGCIKGAKQSTDLSYIPKAEAAGAKIYANCKATKLNKEGNSVKGVKGKVIDPATGKKRYKIEITSKVVCLAMGSMITPAFLLKNRCANSSGLVGKGLTIHPCGRVVAEMDEIVDGHHGVSQGGQIDAFSDEGIMLEGIFLPPSVLTMALPGIGEDHKYLAKHYRNLAVFGIFVADSTRGRIFRSLLPGYEFIAWYSLNQKDTDKFQKAIGIVADIFFAAGAKRVFTGCMKMPILSSKKEVGIFKALKVKPYHFEIIASHPLGTCRLGNDPRSSVINLNLESHDVKGLFITDGSPFPSSLGVNPMETIMTFASRAGQYIGENFHQYL